MTESIRDRIIYLGFAVAVFGLAVGLGGRPQPAPLARVVAAPAESAILHEFTVNGVLEQLKNEGRTAIIEHEEIPDYMEAMTMPFNVRDPKEMKSIKINDQIQFTLKVTEEDSWIENIKLILAGPEDLKAPRREFRYVRNVDQLAVGDLMPDYPLTNQLGQPIRLSDFRGQALAFTFIFTRCPLPDFCPRMSNHFRAVQNNLKSDPDAPDNWHLLSISFDVDFDKPARLKAYGQAVGNDPERWSLATGALIEIDALTEQFGIIFARAEGTWTYNHNLRTVVLDPNGRIHQILIGNYWEAKSLEDLIKDAAKVPVEPKEEAANDSDQ